METSSKPVEEPKKPEKKLVTNPFNSEKQENKSEDLSGWKEPAQKKIGTNPFGSKNEEPKDSAKEPQKNPRKTPADPFGS